MRRLLGMLLAMVMILCAAAPMMPSAKGEETGAAKEERPAASEMISIAFSEVDSTVEGVEEKAVSEVMNHLETMTREIEEIMAEMLDDGTIGTEESLLLTAGDEPLVAFVNRAYQIILGREGETAGVNGWVNALKSGAFTGAQLIQGFVNSAEFTDKGFTNEEKVRKLYQVMLNREPDPSGKLWVDKLDEGAGIDVIVNGFSTSTEFAMVCAVYGIIPGTIEIPASQLNTKVLNFVKRCYSEALNREGDQGGIEYWCGQINNGIQSAADVAKGFVISNESIANYPTDSEKFVEMLYHLYLDRNADEGGKQWWLSQIKGGKTREAIADEFGVAREFRFIVASYGLGAKPETEFTQNDVAYEVLSDGAVSIKKYNGSASSLEIPTIVNSQMAYAVIEVGEGAFENNKTLQSIVLPNTITAIRKAAFRNCTNLSSMSCK